MVAESRKQCTGVKAVGVAAAKQGQMKGQQILVTRKVVASAFRDWQLSSRAETGGSGTTCTFGSLRCSDCRRYACKATIGPEETLTFTRMPGLHNRPL